MGFDPFGKRFLIEGKMVTHILSVTEVNQFCISISLRWKTKL